MADALSQKCLRGLLSTCGRFFTGARKDEICSSIVQVQQFIKTKIWLFYSIHYRELYKCPNGKQLAVDTFKNNKDKYHKIASSLIEKDLSK